MSELKEALSIVSNLLNANDHLHHIANYIKSCDPEWMNSACDRPAIFGLLGHKEYADEKLYELRLKLEELDKGVNK